LDEEKIPEIDFPTLLKASLVLLAAFLIEVLFELFEQVQV